MAKALDLKGRGAIVTGGSSGLGEGISNALLACGADVYIFDLQPPLNQTKAKFFKVNVASEESVLAALKDIPDIHIVVNSAGIGTAGRAATKRGPLPLKDFERTISVNLTGTFNVLRLAAAKMAKQNPLPNPGASDAVRALKDGDQERGVVINIASVAAFDGEGGQAAYAASKAGIVGMTLPIARDFRKLGIRILTIAPGIIKTPMGSMMPKEMEDNFAESTLFPRRIGHPDEIANLVLAIVGNSYLNATTIRCDGGIRLSGL